VSHCGGLPFASDSTAFGSALSRADIAGGVEEPAAEEDAGAKFASSARQGHKYHLGCFLGAVGISQLPAALGIDGIDVCFNDLAEGVGRAGADIFLQRIRQ
jgi:hypothetical protein